MLCACYLKCIKDFNFVNDCNQLDACFLSPAEHKNQSDDLRRALSEIKFCKEREDRLKKDLEVC